MTLTAERARLPRGNLPNFIVAGVSQAGTTALFDALSAHPQVCGSVWKETRYFQKPRYGEPLAPIGDYRAYFRRYSGQPVTMECTSDYFYGGSATAHAIKEICDPQVTIILREPISRLIAFYRFMQGRLQIPPEETLRRYVERCQAVPEGEINRRTNNAYTGLWGGQYARFLPEWLAAYPGRCDIYFFEDLIADPAALLAAQCARLGIDPLEALTTDVDAHHPGAYRSRGAQRVVARAARHSRPLFRRHPHLYGHARRTYVALNQRPAAEPPIAATVRREISALYRPWNDLLAQQLRETGHHALPQWLTQ